MTTSISEVVVGDNLDFTMWDSISYSDSSLPFGDILSANHVRELFANNDALFGSWENDVWNTVDPVCPFAKATEDGSQGRLLSSLCFDAVIR